MISITIDPAGSFPYPVVVYLPLTTPEYARSLASRIDPAEILEFDPCGWNHSLHHLPATYPQHFPVSVGTLYWPDTASQFAVGYYLATAEDVDLIKSRAFKSTGPQPVRLTLSDNDDSAPDGTTVGTVDLPMFLLPPRPLDAISGQEGKSKCYLLTLVDQRYFWWFTDDQIVVDPGTTLWTDLVDDIADALGVSVTFGGGVDVGYGRPSNRYTAYSQPLPLLLDAALSQIGHVLVANYDGTLVAQDYAASRAVQLVNGGRISPHDGDFYPLGGGTFDPTLLAKNVPSQVVVVFSRKLSTTGYSYTPYRRAVTLASLGLTSPGEPFAGVVGFTGAKTIMGDMAATITPPATVPTNVADLNSYAVLIADSYYTSCLASYDQSFSGIAAWAPNGLTDLVRFDYEVGKITTRVMRGPWEEKSWGRVRLSDLPGMASSYPAGAADGIRFVKITSVVPEPTSIEVTVDDAATTYTVTDSDGNFVSVPGSGVDTDTTASDLRDALAASADSGFACAVWTVTGSTITFAPATITVLATSGTGTMSVNGAVVTIDSDDASTTYQVTINSLSVSVSGSGTGVDDTATALQVALAASTDDGFADATWTAVAATVTRSPDPACPYGLSATVSGGDGEMSTETDDLYPAKEVFSDLAKTLGADAYYRSSNGAVPRVDAYHEVVLLTDAYCATKVYQDAPDGITVRLGDGTSRIDGVIVHSFRETDGFRNDPTGDPAESLTGLDYSKVCQRLYSYEEPQTLTVVTKVCQVKNEEGNVVNVSYETRTIEIPACASIGGPVCFDADSECCPSGLCCESCDDVMDDLVATLTDATVGTVVVNLSKDVVPICDPCTWSGSTVIIGGDYDGQTLYLTMAINPGSSCAQIHGNIGNSACPPDCGFGYANDDFACSPFYAQFVTNIHIATPDCGSSIIVDQVIVTE